MECPVGRTETKECPVANNEECSTETFQRRREDFGFVLHELGVVDGCEQRRDVSGSSVTRCSQTSQEKTDCGLGVGNREWKPETREEGNASRR